MRQCTDTAFGHYEAMSTCDQVLIEETQEETRIFSIKEWSYLLCPSARYLGNILLSQFVGTSVQKPTLFSFVHLSGGRGEKRSRALESN